MKKLKNDYPKLIALILGITLVITGIIFMVKSEDIHSTTGEGLTRVPTDIEFGADYYTTSAQNTALTANAVCDLYTMITTGIGVFFVFVGGIDICIISSKLKNGKTKLKE